MAPHGIAQPAVSITHGRRTVNGSRSGLSETSTILIRISAWLARKAGDYQPDQWRLHQHLPQWVLDGNAILFTTERYGMRAHASWGSLNDAMLVFMNQDAYDKFRLSKEDYELQKELEKEQKEVTGDKTDDKKKKIKPMKRKTKSPRIS